MKIERPTTVELVGRGKLTLVKTDHVATGGEGSVYLKGNTVIKLYADSNKMQQDNMVAKVQELSAFGHQYIVAPKGVVLNERGAAVGFYMDYVDGEPFSRLFTNKFRKRAGFGDTEASVLADRMLQVFTFAHDRKAVLVDPNELNWVAMLRGPDGPEPRILDVDSWALGQWPPRAVMLSIRDFHASKFTPLTDMFGWGIVTFQLYTGIHPYKGELAGYGMADLEGRMRANASVFSPGVALPMAVRDFGCVPGPLLGWYEATFQNGERTMPPSPFDTGVTAPARQVKVTRITTTVSGLLRYVRLLDNNDPAVRIFPCGVVLLESGTLYDLGTKRNIGSASRDCEVLRVNGGWLITQAVARQMTYTFINGTNYQPQLVEPPIQSGTVLRYENRLFAVAHGGITELHFRRFGVRGILSSGATWGAQPKSTTWYDGVGVMDSMGATFLVAPFGQDVGALVRAPELDGYRIVAAKAGHRYIAAVAVDPTGQYEQFGFVMDRRYANYRLIRETVQTAELNLALVPRGDAGVVGATVQRDGELQVFVPSTSTINTVADKDVSTDMILANWDAQVVFIRDGQVWSLSMS